MFSCFRPTRDERNMRLPGDRFVPTITAAATHAVTINAPHSSVWPWLLQMGAGRAGWYSYDKVDNEGRDSAWEIRPELQPVAVGDVMPALPGATEAFIVSMIEPERDLVLTVPAEDAGDIASWEFYLTPCDEGARLIVRVRIDARWPLGGAGKAPENPRPIERVYAILGRTPRWLTLALARFGHGFMARRQLAGIKARAEDRTK